MSSTKPAQAKPRMTSDERRAAIVQAACRLFAEKGFRGTTTRELAAAVGVTEPVLYEHFRTKRDLYSAIIGEKAKEGLAAMRAIEAQFAGSNDDARFFNALGEGVIRWYTEDPTFVRLLLYSSLENHELKDLMHERSAEVFSIVGDHIQRRINAGAMRAVDPMLAGRAFFGMVAHYALTGLVFGCAPLNKDTKQVVTEMVSIFIDGMCIGGNQQK
jgi:AcrR family transcriptional regulator